MTTPLTYNNGRHGPYGLGLYARREAGRRVFGHGGRMPGFRAEVSCYPDDDLALVVLTNLHGIDPYGLGRHLATAWLDIDPLSAAGAVSAPPPAGRYLARESGDFLELQHENGRPVLAATSGPLPLAPTDDGRWEPVSATWDLRLATEAAGLEADSCGRRIRYVPIEPPPAMPSADFVGNFRCDSLGSIYRVRVNSAGRLAVRMQGELGYYDTILEPITADLFRAAPADPRAAWNQPLLRFARGIGGAVEALLYSTDRTRDLRFEKERS